jgi:cell division protein FtsQ
MPGRATAGAMSGFLFAIVVVAAAPHAWSWVKSHPYFVLTSVEVEGNLRTSDADILALAGIQAGESMWDVSPSAVRARLSAHPWIQRATVRRDGPGRIVIEVRERKPIAIVRFDQLHYVDRRGHVLGELGGDDSRNLPMITGLEGDLRRAYAPVALPRIAQLLRWCERRGSIDELSEIHVDREDGVTMYPLDNHVAVHLGWGRWREKLNRSARVFEAWKGRMGQLATVDVSLPETVIVRPREDIQPAQQPTKAGRRI